MSENEVERFDVPIVQFLLEQLASLKGRRQEIVDSGDTDALDNLDGVIADTNKAATSISLSQHAREEAREKYEKWRAILPKCRAALRKYEEICRDLEKAVFKTSELESRASHAFDIVCQTQDQRPQNSSYPTDEEIAAHEARVRSAESIHKERVAKLVAAKERQAVLTRQQWETRNEYNALEFQERQLRPRQDAQPAPLLSAVR
ncbi:MAG: hypothetical protein WCC97_18685 [Candidatus Acidiferrales bacterium]